MKNILIIFFVLSVASSSAQTKIQHTTTSANISGNSTFLNAEGLNGNPRAIVIIVEYTSATRVTNPHPTGVWYFGNKWAVFNEDRAPMPPGITFSIAWKNPDANAFVYKAVTDENRLNHPILDRNPSARFYITQNWNPDASNGVYNPEDVIAFYDTRANNWKMKNYNESRIPAGAAFNILVLNLVESELTGTTIRNEAIGDDKTRVPAIKNPKDIPNLASVNTYTDARLNHLFTVVNEEEIKQYIQSLPFEKQFIIQTETQDAMRTYFIAHSGKTDNDKDGDGFIGTYAGGNDGDDFSNFSYPGKAELCNGINIFNLGGLRLVWIYALGDEDCDLLTVKLEETYDGDEDGDGIINCNCKNLSEIPPWFTITKWSSITYSEFNLPNKMHYRYVVSGIDCDDKNPNIGKEGQKCISPTKVGMCVGGGWKTFDCIKCVTQPNGSGLVVEW
jgi:hypothetical protein